MLPAPDVIFCPGFQPDVPLLISAARQAGIKATFLGGSTWDDRERFHSILEDNSILDGSYYPTNFSVATPGRRCPRIRRKLHDAVWKSA